jgi:hypothetical protein
MGQRSPKRSTGRATIEAQLAKQPDDPISLATRLVDAGVGRKEEVSAKDGAAAAATRTRSTVTVARVGDDPRLADAKAP